MRWSCRLCRLCRSCPSVPVRARPCAPPPVPLRFFLVNGDVADESVRCWRRAISYRNGAGRGPCGAQARRSDSGASLPANSNNREQQRDTTFSSDIFSLQHWKSLDEMMQRVQLNAMGIALGLGIVGGLSFSLLETSDIIQTEFSLSFMVILMALSYLISTIVGMKRLQCHSQGGWRQLRLQHKNENVNKKNQCFSYRPTDKLRETISMRRAS